MHFGYMTFPGFHGNRSCDLKEDAHYSNIIDHIFLHFTDYALFLFLSLNTLFSLLSFFFFGLSVTQMLPRIPEFLYNG